MNPTNQAASYRSTHLPSDRNRDTDNSDSRKGSKRLREEGDDSTSSSADKRLAILLTVATAGSLKLLTESPISALQSNNTPQQMRGPYHTNLVASHLIPPLPNDGPSFLHPLLNKCFNRVKAKLPNIKFQTAHFLAPESTSSHNTSLTTQEIKVNQLDEAFALGVLIYTFIYSSLPYRQENEQAKVPSADKGFKKQLDQIKGEIESSSQLPPTLKSLATLSTQLLEPNPTERLDMPSTLYQINLICHSSLKSGSSAPLHLIADLGLLTPHIDIPEQDGRTLAHNALLYGAASAIPILEQNGISLETEDGNHQTPIMVAASFNLIQALQQLQQSGANPNTVNQNGYSALHYAIRNRSIDAIKCLLPTDEAIFGKASYNSALHFAASSGNLTALDLCLNSSVPHLSNINLRNRSGETPLLLAIIHNNMEVVDALLNRGANIDVWTEDRNTPLHFAIKNDAPDMVSRLIGENAQTILPNSAQETPLLLALLGRNPEIIQMMIEIAHDDEDYSLSLSTHPSEPIALAILTAYIDSKNSVDLCDIHTLTMMIEKNNELINHLPNDETVYSYQEALSHFTGEMANPISAEQLQRKLLNASISFYKVQWKKDRALYIDDLQEYYREKLTVPVDRNAELLGITRALPSILHSNIVRYRFRDDNNRIAVDFGGLTKQILGDAIHQAIKEKMVISGIEHSLFESEENSNGFLLPPVLSRTTSVLAYQYFGQLLAAALPTSVAIGPYFSTTFFNLIIDFSEKICRSDWAKADSLELNDNYDQLKDLNTLTLLDTLSEKEPDFIIALLDELEDQKTATDGGNASNTSAHSNRQMALNRAINRWFLLGHRKEDRQVIQVNLKHFEMLTEEESTQTENIDNLITEKLNDNGLISSHAEAQENLKTLAAQKLHAYAAIALGISQAPQAADHIIQMGAKTFQISLCGHKDLRNNMLEALQRPKAATSPMTTAELEAETRHNQATLNKVKRYIQTAELPKLVALCRFWTGYEQLGADAKLEIIPKLSSDLLKSSSCFNALYLPSKRCREASSFEQFKEYLDQSLLTFMDDPNSFNAN